MLRNLAGQGLHSIQQLLLSRNAMLKGNAVRKKKNPLVKFTHFLVVFDIKMQSCYFLCLVGI